MRKASTIAVLDLVASHTEAELGKVYKSIDDLKDRRDELEERVCHVREAIRAVRDANDKWVTAPQPGTVKAQVTDAAQSIIRADGPQHRRVLLSSIENHGVIVGGRDPLGNMSAYLSRDSRFIASGDGVWSLADEQGPACDVAAD